MSEERKISYLVNALPKEFHKPLLSSGVREWNAAIEKIRQQEIVLKDSDRIVLVQKKIQESNGNGEKNLLEVKSNVTSEPSKISKKREDMETPKLVPVMTIENNSPEEDRRKFGKPRGGATFRGRGVGPRRGIPSGGRDRNFSDSSMIKVWKTQEGFPICYNCQKVGHLSRSCPMARDGTKPENSNLKEGVPSQTKEPI